MAEATAVEVALVGLLILLGVLLGLIISLDLFLRLQLQLPPRPRRAPRRPHRAPSWCLLWCPRASARAADGPARPRPADTEDLCLPLKRKELDNQTCQEEEEKTKLQNNICILAKKLARVNETLAGKMASKNECDQTTAETEAAS